MSTPLVDDARAYLCSFAGVDDRLINEHLHLWKRGKKKSIPELYRSLLEHAKNRQSLPNIIGDTEKLRTILFDFDPRQVLAHYCDHVALLREIKHQHIKTPSPIRLTNTQSHWVIYAKSALSCARFISTFETADAFHKFVRRFYANEYSRLALPLLLKEELYGFGFALACDFLKDNGYSGFVKPDTHVKDICRAAGITDSGTDFGVFKDVVAYCMRHDLVPYEFDKLIWLVGSGTFHLRGVRVGTQKSQFIQRYLSDG